MGRVGIIQTVSTADLETNLNDLFPFFDNAIKQKVEVIVLPENFAFMGHTETDKFKIAEDEGDGQIQRFVSQLARDY